MSTHFLEPTRLWLLIVPAALAVLYVVVLRWRKGAQLRFTQIDLLDQVAPQRPRWRRHVVATLQILGLAAMVIAVARPIHRTTETTTSDGRILVLFDVSLSMESTDVDPTRFEAAQKAAQNFVDKVEPGVEVGLVSFSGQVNVDVEPTLDRTKMRDGIDKLQLGESTAIGDALSTGTRILTASADPNAPKGKAPGVMVLLSDGETTVGSPTSQGAQEAADAGIPVYTIAFGTAQGSITDPASGQVVPVPVKPAALEQVAKVTGGQAFEAKTGDELTNAYNQIRQSLGKTLGETVEKINELTWEWALAAFVMLAAAWGLSLWWLRGMV
jgi:Ca-activated chloride channel family protein